MSSTEVTNVSELDIQLRAYFRFAIPTLIIVPLVAYLRNYSMREAIHLLFFILLFNAFVATVYYLIRRSKQKASD